MTPLFDSAEAYNTLDFLNTAEKLYWPEVLGLYNQA